jgi:hypothetical protein
MADEIRRVGRRYIVQTPNRFFPVEPHFFVPLFQFYPLALQIWLIRHFSLGWFPKTPDREKAMEMARSVDLLSRKKVRLFFPEAQLMEEKFLGMTKSFVAIHPGL